MSNDKMLALRGRRAVWAPVPKDTGPIDPSRLPEGYPYKEQSEETIIPENTYSFVADAGGFLGTVPEPDISRLFVAGEKLRLILNGEVCDGMATSTTTAEFTFPSSGYICGLTFISAAGYYRIKIPLSGDVTVKLEAVTETIHPMAEEFLPEGVGGGGLAVIDTSVPLSELPLNAYCLLNGTYKPSPGYEANIDFSGAVAYVQDYKGHPAICAIDLLGGLYRYIIAFDSGPANVVKEMNVTMENNYFFDDSGNQWKINVDSDGNLSAEKIV